MSIIEGFFFQVVLDIPVFFVNILVHLPMTQFRWLMAKYITAKSLNVRTCTKILVDQMKLC